MRGSAYSKNGEHKDLFQLHNCLIALEKIELRRSYENIPEKEIEMKCQEIIDQLAVMAGIVKDRQIIAVNAKVIELLGYTSSELIGSNFNRFLHPSELPEILLQYEKRLEGNEMPLIFETILMHRNGNNLYVRIITSLFTYLGKPASLGIIKVLGETI
jgi:PAS domain S-box-containing protein